MDYPILIKITFLLLLLTYLYVFKKLIYKGFSFSLGILFGILYFIFIPIIVLIFTDKIELSLIDFSQTNLNDVMINNTIYSSMIIILYLITILIFIYMSELFKSSTYTKRCSTNLSKKQNIFIPSWKNSLFLSISFGVIIFFASGLYNGGDWYISRENFFKNSGFLALILMDLYIAFKIMFMASIVISWINKEIRNIYFIFIILIFSIIDVVLTGNRIYVFVMMSIIIIQMIKIHGKKVFFSFFIFIPFGYMMSIYRHIRGELFVTGIPSFGDIIDITAKTIKNDPPDITSFLLGISESVNVNVIYEIMQYVTLNNILGGDTFIKAFVFFIPRSIWEEKPISITQIAGNYFAPNVEHLSLVTTLIGEAHMNFHLFGIIILPVILLITKKLFSFLFGNNYFEVIVLFILGLLIFRMPFSDVLLVSFFTFIVYKRKKLLKKLGY